MHLKKCQPKYWVKRSVWVRMVCLVSILSQNHALIKRTELLFGCQSLMNPPPAYFPSGFEFLPRVYSGSLALCSILAPWPLSYLRLPGLINAPWPNPGSIVQFSRLSSLIPQDPWPNFYLVVVAASIEVVVVISRLS